jgi:glycosyltransferase involved in cell wall biosynthesis
MPKVSVVMPAYNALPFLEKAVTSILDQTHTDLELLVADDASTDSTKAYLDALDDPRVTCYHNEVNSGYLRTCNKLMSLATGDYITFQDADDYSDVTRLAVQLEVFEKEPELMVLGTNRTKVGVDGLVGEDSIVPITYKEVSEWIPESFPFCNSLMFNKAVYEDIGGYNDFFHRVGAEDFYWLALMAEKYNTRYLPESYYFYRHVADSVTGNLDNLRKLIIVDLVRFLLNQRAENGTDALESGEMGPLNDEIFRLEEPYRKDKLLFKKKKIQKHFWNANYGKGFKLAFGVLIRNPFQPKEFYKDLYIYLPRWIKG